MRAASRPGHLWCRAVVILFALALVAAACSDDDTPTTAASGTTAPAGPSGSVTAALATDVRSLNPIMDGSARPVLNSVFDQLLVIQADGSTAASLATAWESNANATQWTFTIRTDAKFHDNTPVTADDVVFSYTQILKSPTSNQQGSVNMIDTAEKLAADKVRFNLKQPFSYFPRQTSLTSIVPMAKYDEVGFQNAPIGSGPYRVASWSSGQPVVIEAFAGYWGPKPAFQTVTMVPAPQADTRLTGLQSTSTGSFALSPLTSDQVSVAEGGSGLKVVSRPSNFVAYLSFNVTKAPYSDLKLRQAINQAIDREAITRTLYRGKAKPIGQMVASVTFGYDPAIGPARYDPAAARRLLAESSYAGESLVFEYPTDGELQSSTDLAQAIQGYLQAVGIKVDLQGRASTAFIPAVQRKQMQGMFMFSWRPSLMDAALVLNRSFRTADWGYATDAELDRLVAAQSAESDPAKRAALISQIWKLNEAQVYFAPIYTDEYHYGLRSNVAAYTPRADGYIIPHEIRKP
jgi:peptide/nickel transport system substrate-binding protein